MYIEILAQKFCDYSIHIRGYSKETIKRYKRNIRLFCRFTKFEKIEDVTHDSVREYLYYGRVDRHWKAASFISSHVSLLVFFRWCVTNKYMQLNPALDIEKPKLEKRLPPKLSKEDSQKLLELVYNQPYCSKFLRYRNHAIFAVFLFAGLRKKELINLKLSDVDIEHLSIFVQQGKGNKDRIVPMSYTLAQTLTRYLEERKRLKKTCPEFFASSTYNDCFTESGLKHLVISIQKISKIKFNVHKLRHTFATLMLEGGCDIYSLSRMMGHSDIKTTTIYLYASAEHFYAPK